MGNTIQGEFLFLSDMSNKINLICNASRISMQHFLKSLFAQKPTLMNRVACCSQCRDGVNISRYNTTRFREKM